jgi:hypothetical protein
MTAVENANVDQEEECILEQIRDTLRHRINHHKIHIAALKVLKSEFEQEGAGEEQLIQISNSLTNRTYRLWEAQAIADILGINLANSESS